MAKVSKPNRRRWHQYRGIVYFTVTSDGTPGPEWINRLKAKGFRLSASAQSLLRSPEFDPTSGVTTEIAVFKGSLFPDNGRTTRDIRAVAGTWKLKNPNAEVACLIRENFTDEEIEAMRLNFLIAMHEPIYSYGVPYLLYVSRGGGLFACYGVPNLRLNRGDGFAFAVPQVGT